MPHLAVSSFSLHTQLGPLSIDTRAQDGSLSPMLIPFPKTMDLEGFIDRVRSQLGLDAVELCQIQFGAGDRSRSHALRGHLDRADVRMLTMPIDIGDLAQTRADWRAEDERRITGWFDVARTLGARYVRVNAGTPGTGFGSDAWDGLVAALRRLGDAAASTGLRLLTENHGGTSSSPEFIRTLIGAVGTERLGLLLDVGNFEPLVTLSQARFFDPGVADDGIDLEPLYAAIAELAPMAELVHAKSLAPSRRGMPLPDLDRALGIVADAGYDGSISLEWEGRDGDPWMHLAEMATIVRKHFPHLA